MSYFDSLSSWQNAASSIQQHQQDAEQENNDAKASTIEEKFDAVDKYMNESGAALGGFGGGIHLVRRMYKKGKAAQQKIKEAKAAYEKAKGNAPDGKTGNPDNENADANGKTPDEHSKMNGTEDEPTNADTGVPKGGEQEMSDASDWAKSGDKNSGNDGNNAKPDDVKDNGNDADTQPKANDTQQSGQDAAEDSGGKADNSALKGDEDPDDFSFFPDKEPNTAGADIFDSTPKVGEPPSGAGGASGGAEGSGTIATDAGGDVSSLGGSGGMPRSQAQQFTQEQVNVEDTPLGKSEASSGADSGGQAAAEGEQNIKSAVDSGSDAAKGALNGLKDGASDMVDQTASKVSGAASKVSDVVDATTDAAKVAAKGTLDAALETAGGVMDFLGPVGEIVGAGLALGSFFHDLFGSKKKTDQEDADQNQKTIISQGTGISTTSMATAATKSNVVGTLV